MFGRRTQSLMACLAVVALLLCQAVGLVQGHQFDRTGVQVTGAACHTVPDEQGGSDKAAHAGCDSGPTASEAVKLPASMPAILPPTFVFLERPSGYPSAASWTLQLRFAGVPPPLHLLHCCLRN